MPENQDSKIDDIREFCVSFVLPAFVLAICAILLLTGRDGETKAIFAMAAGWLFKSGYERKKK